LGASGIGKVNLPPERHVTWRLLASSKTISFFDGPETDDRLGHNLDLFLSPDAHNLEISENKDGIPLRIPARKNADNIDRNAGCEASKPSRIVHVSVLQLGNLEINDPYNAKSWSSSGIAPFLSVSATFKNATRSAS
jgi:hypothetical protein